MIKSCEDMPECSFAHVCSISSRDLRDFLAELDPAEDDSILCWKHRETFVAHRGIWLQRGTYRLKHGSFVDPHDLAVYGGNYFVAHDAGSHRAVQIGFGSHAPDAARMLATAADLKNALRDILETEASEANADASPDDPAQAPLKLLQPDSAFEYHGKLTNGWHLKIYQADDEAGTEILVFE